MVPAEWTQRRRHYFGSRDSLNGLTQISNLVGLFLSQQNSQATYAQAQW
jgi:hypothetical protein